MRILFFILMFCSVSYAETEIVNIHRNNAEINDAMCISTVNNNIPLLYLCDENREFTFYGVYAGKDEDGNNLVISSGQAYVKVCNKGFNIAIGEYLVTSGYEGHLQRQRDNILKPETAVRALEDVIWNDDEVERIIKVEIILQGL